MCTTASGGWRCQPSAAAGPCSPLPQRQAYPQRGTLQGQQHVHADLCMASWHAAASCSMQSRVASRCCMQPSGAAARSPRPVKMTLEACVSCASPCQHAAARCAARAPASIIMSVASGGSSCPAPPQASLSGAQSRRTWPYCCAASPLWLSPCCGTSARRGCRCWTSSGPPGPHQRRLAAVAWQLLEQERDQHPVQAVGNNVFSMTQSTAQRTAAVQHVPNVPLQSMHNSAPAIASAWEAHGTLHVVCHSW